MKKMNPIIKLPETHIYCSPCKALRLRLWTVIFPRCFCVWRIRKVLLRVWRTSWWNFFVYKDSSVPHFFECVPQFQCSTFSLFFFLGRWKPNLITEDPRDCPRPWPLPTRVPNLGQITTNSNFHFQRATLSKTDEEIEKCPQSKQWGVGAFIRLYNLPELHVFGGIYLPSSEGSHKAPAEKFWKCDFSSVSEKVFPGFLGGFFCCWTPSKKGAF